MKRIFVGCVMMVLLSQVTCFAQTTNSIKDDSLKNFCRYLMKNIHYPAVAKENNIQGKEIISITITRQSITDIKVVRSLTAQCDTEVVRKLENFNKSLHPAIELIPGKYTLVIHFALDYNDGLNLSSVPNKLISDNVIDMGIISYAEVKHQSLN
ncbi:energy transducer TonB [Mucilaginibacter sp. AW1-3]